MQRVKFLLVTQTGMHIAMCDSTSAQVTCVQEATSCKHRLCGFVLLYAVVVFVLLYAVACQTLSAARLD